MRRRARSSVAGCPLHRTFPHGIWCGVGRGTSKAGCPLRRTFPQGIRCGAGRGPGDRLPPSLHVFTRNSVQSRARPNPTWPVNAHGATGNGSKNSDGDKHRRAPERTGPEHHPRKTPTANHAQHLGSPVRTLPLRPPRPAGKCAAESTTNGRVSGSTRPRRVPRRQGAPSAQIRPGAAGGTT